MQLYIHDLFRRPVEKQVASWLKDIDRRDECQFLLAMGVGAELFSLEDADLELLLVTREAILRSVYRGCSRQVAG